MAKRRADIELNQDNWDDDLRATTKGNFDKADKDIISQRKILTARTNRTSVSLPLCNYLLLIRVERLDYLNHLPLFLTAQVETQYHSILDSNIQVLKKMAIRMKRLSILNTYKLSIRAYSIGLQNTLKKTHFVFSTRYSPITTNIYRESTLNFPNNH